MTDNLAEEAVRVTTTPTARQPESPAAEPGPESFTARGDALSGWWAVAAETDIGDAPVAVRLAGRDLALYRDGRGVVRAVDDLCPHRRLPMSLGRVTGDGQIQCGYHGWIFDGASGRCTAIPNLTADERPAGRIRLPVFSTDSWQGLVLVWTGDELAPRIPSPVLAGPAASIKGHLEVRAPVGLVLDALTVNPGAALGLGPVFGAGEEETEPSARLEGNVLRVDRVRQTFGLPRVGTFDPFVDHTTAATIAVHSGTGLVEVATQRAVAGVRARMLVGVAP
ncbi:MAG: hypothetical protein QOJ03_202, partial [Frankiaceae bacterium]|nr:hypothetical protein [Frankiaceae bacterium]